MNQNINVLRKEDPLRRIPEKNSLEIRYLTFNVNSIKTLFNYYPWNQLNNSVDSLLSCLNADIVSLQELKVPSNGLQQVGVLDQYRSFVLIPKSKRGYSGVGLYIRIPKKHETPVVKQNLTVIKAEEGVTGYLIDPSSKGPYCESSDGIGGYLSEEQIKDLELKHSDFTDLDSEGRCVIVELANGNVIFSLYCPANSTQTSEGQEFRIRFLHCLLLRSMNLKLMGKNVIIMGDINVSPDLIDNAEAINLLTKNKIITNNTIDGGFEFEKSNLEACLAFRSDGSHRRLLNMYLKPTMAGVPTEDTHFLHDTTRHHKKRQTEVYTVWNTQTNSRQSNYGSRIDLILVSSETQLDKVSKADILPFLFGSDHCPVFTDFDVSKEEHIDLPDCKKLSFEAKNYFKLVKHRDISSMFSAFTRKRDESPISADNSSLAMEKRQKPAPDKKLSYVSRKSTNSSQQPINSFFFGSKPSSTNELKLAKKDSLQALCVEETAPTKNGVLVNSIADIASKQYNTPPMCLHNEPTVLKTSYTPSTKGKKFWCCGRNSKGKSTEFGEHRCNFFAWATKK